ncbi:hypothetical protein [Sulfurimonas sp.]
MKQIQRYDILISMLLLFSIFSFSVFTFIENTSSSSYEIVIDNNDESDDIENEAEKKLFLFSEIFIYIFINVNKIFSHLETKFFNPLVEEPHFRPPIFFS